jgi:magnesium chelatase family protein
VRAAVVNSGFEFPAKRITVNLAPAYLRKAGPGFDLPIAMAVLAASGQLAAEALNGCAVEGELSLTGELRATRGTLAIAEGAARHGLGRLLLPATRAREAALVPALQVLGVDDAAGSVEVARGDREPAPVPSPMPRLEDAGEDADLSDVRATTRSSPRSRSSPPAATTCSCTARPAPARR